MHESTGKIINNKCNGLKMMLQVTYMYVAVANQDRSKKNADI